MAKTSVDTIVIVIVKQFILLLIHYSSHNKDDDKEDSLQRKHFPQFQSKKNKLFIPQYFGIRKNSSNSMTFANHAKIKPSASFQLDTQMIIPMVIFCSYRPEYTVKLIDSLKNLQFLNPQTPCLFVLHKSPKVTEESVKGMNDLLNKIDFCKVIKWRVIDLSKNRTSKAFKMHWYKVVAKVFEDRDIFHLGQVYRKDVIFLEDDIILSPDAIKVFSYGIQVKKSRQRVIAVGLGGWSGENLINAHPDTFDIRYSAFFPSMAYAFNASFWKTIKTSKFLKIPNNDWSESLGLIINRFINPRPLFLLPTLGRLWHVGKAGLGLRGDGSIRRDVQIAAHWLKSPRLINLETASVNTGIRDIFGFVCKESELRNIFTMRCLCPQSYQRFPPDRRFEIVCYQFGNYIRDPCLKKFPFLYRDESQWS
ncbi:uncharacterized protein TRIADDRAFT_60274 [Trichoplax adhaerens]|uniref:Uncharacterized protein n=1 Tax=Trichoplax adhaerens TaxID=10228 RepID=B3S7S3_TRIAD|nr:hypothetical protein TRIADDRAFT_60274 [Trichoplax adhaerens]EDV21246.1 hypothetical protein TRIADDRAFT_60274 [Trichoplax adhaerens]|eukprot:XP_002116213.1 hypothetical protein TRIADDRAFT_60274 [Trichoplax adhaerens]